MYTGYAEASDYEAYGDGSIPSDVLTKRLRTASRHVDSLTFGRIVDRGLANLTTFQRDIVVEVVCQLADWEYAHEDELQAIVSGYSINGVSMQFGGAGVKLESGVYIPSGLYALLKQTGLCCRLAV